MVEITGSVVEQSSENGSLVTTFRIPALSENLAEQQARGNAIVKGFSGVEVVDVNYVEDGEIPGQKMYHVTVRSER